MLVDMWCQVGEAVHEAAHDEGHRKHEPVQPRAFCSASLGLHLPDVLHAIRQGRRTALGSSTAPLQARLWRGPPSPLSARMIRSARRARGESGIALAPTRTARETPAAYWRRRS